MPGTLPASNVGGNNQTSPGLGAAGMAPTSIFTPAAGGSTVPSGNPYMSSAPTSTVPGGGTYNTTSHYSGGQTDINKQLVDILGKGVGGGLDTLMKNMSGNNSAIFQQWLASQVPANAAAEAQLRQGMGAMGVSGNSTPMALGEANLAAQENATAAGVNAGLMQMGVQDTMGILQGTQDLAAKQVATTPLSIFGNVMSQVGQDAAALFGGAGGAALAKHFLPSGGGADAGSIFSALSPDRSLAGSNWSDTLPSDPGSLLS